MDSRFVQATDLESSFFKPKKPALRAGFFAHVKNTA